jgi:hypothetical protein
VNNVNKKFLFLIWAGYVGLFCILGFYAHPSADDYNLANMVNRYGFWQALVQWYTSWPVSPIHQILVSFPAWLNFKGYFLLASVTCFVNVCVLYGLAHVAAKNAGPGKKFSFALLMQAIWLSMIPGLNENFYWLDGMGYTWNSTFLLLTIAFLITFFKKSEFDLKLGMASAILLFLTSSYSAQISLFLCVLFFCLSCGYFIVKKQTRAVYFLTMTCIAFAGFLVLYLSPGTTVRMGTGGRNILQTFEIAALFGGVTILKFFMKPLVYLLILYMPDVSTCVYPFDKNITTHLKAWHIFALVALIAPFQQAIAGWAISGSLPPRAEGLVIWIMAASWLFLWSFGYRSEAMFAKIRSLRIYPWRGVLLAFCLVLNSNFLSLLQDLRIAPLYADEHRQREALILQQKNEGEADIVVPSLTVKPGLLFFADIQPSPNDWKNQSFAEYWGVRSISALPASLLNDERKRRDFQEGKPEGLEALAETGDPEAQFMLAEIYDTRFTASDGIPKNNATAVKWYRMAAEQGHTPAQRRLFRLYATGMGVPQNYFTALNWLLRSQF